MQIILGWESVFNLTKGNKFSTENKEFSVILSYVFSVPYQELAFTKQRNHVIIYRHNDILSFFVWIYTIS